jgi:GntR family transcriptional regulator/MocR family aminotransferase
VTSAAVAGPELLLVLDRAAAVPLRVQLEDALRDAVRTGALAPGAAMPPSRTLAADLGVSRRLVVDAYQQLIAEGYLASAARSGTFVSATAAGPPPVAPPEPVARYDLKPGTPDLAGFPRVAWRQALSRVIRTAPDEVLRYPDPAGRIELRVALAGYLRRVRGVACAPGQIVICGGFTQALALLTRALSAEAGRPAVIAVEDPGVPGRDRVIAAAGGRCVPVPVDEHGLRADLARQVAADAVLVTPAHQFPTGVPLDPARRAAVTAAAPLVIEDDYDAEFRYDREPLTALHALSPQTVAYTGSVSKTLAPALRLGWLVVPEHLAGAVRDAKRDADAGAAVFDQLALADLIGSGRYDRHLRAARRRYRARRDALVAALAEHAPGVRLTGIAAGLHALASLPAGTDIDGVLRHAHTLGVALSPAHEYFLAGVPPVPQLVLGYASLSEPAVAAAVRLAGQAITAACPPQPPTSARGGDVGVVHRAYDAPGNTAASSSRGVAGQEHARHNQA